MSGGGAIWLTAVLGLAGLVAVELMDESPLTPAVIAASSDAAGTAPAPAEPPAASLPSAALIEDIVGRPLFSPSRRPRVAAREQIEMPIPAPAQALGLELVGTMLKGGSPIALLRHPVDGLLRLRQGQAVRGWTIAAIDEAGVLVENGARAETLTLRKDISRLAAPRAAGERPGLVEAERPAEAGERRETADRQ
jgi:hypothetical protein